MHEFTDADLVALARSGDTEAFRVLIERYQFIAFSIAMHFASQSEVAQDLAQEAMLQAYLSLDQLREVIRFKNWFYGIVLNVCRNWRRRQRAAMLSMDVWQAYQAFADSADPYDVVEEQELRCTVQKAMLDLSTKNREVMLLFYYEDLSLDEIAERLNLSLAAVKSRLHKSRSQLKKQLVMIYPELTRVTSSKQRRTIMTNVKIVKVLPLVPRVLVVLLDQAGQRVLPLWLNPDEGHPLVMQERRASQVPIELATIDFVANLLQATGGKVQAVHIEELQEQLFYARVFLHSLNGGREVKARLGDALALAQREGSDIVVEDLVVARSGVNLATVKQGTLDQQLDQVIDVVSRKAGIPLASKLPEAPRIKEPQNLQFTEGLKRWDLRGSFLHDMTGSHWQDYECGTDATGPQPGAVSGYLKARVPNPTGFADLRQAILADDYQDKRVRLSADIKTVDVEQQAGLYLRIVDRAQTRANLDRQVITFQKTQDWTRYETQIEVPPDSVFILFGISLTGKGQVRVTNVQLESVESTSR